MKNHSFTILLILLISMISTNVWAYDIAVQNADGVTIYYNYINDGNELEVVSGDIKYSYYVVIPDEVTYMDRTRKVTSIDKSAFSGNSGLTSVRIGNCVTNIESNAFDHCSGLFSITIGNSVKSIGNNAFDHCLGLYSVTIPNSVMSIGTAAFRACSNLSSITISDGVTSIGDEAFFGCSGLQSVTIGNNVTSIGNSTFQNCYGLKSLTISNSVTSIGGYAFSHCYGLQSLTIPNNVKSIGNGAFSGCRSLASIDVALGNAIYDSRDNCNAIIERATNTLICGCKKTIIPASVKSIADNAFSGCSGLISVTIPNNVTNIGSQAFYDCDGLITVIAEMKTPIGISSNTFSNRKNATLYVPYGSKAAYAAANYWKDFKEIVEKAETTEVTDVIDISQTNNAIYVESLSAHADEDVSIKVCMKNANTVTSYGFELVLPQRLSIATTSDGDFDAAITMGARHKGHTLITNKLANNTYKVGVASLSAKALTGNDGLVLTIKAHVADNMAVGEYPLLIQNPLIVNTDGTKPAVQSTQSKITIEDYTKGDVDGDNVVDLADAVLVINHYVGKPVNKFLAKAADVDGDGVIDLADAVRIINFYVGKVQSLAPSIVLDGLDPQ